MRVAIVVGARAPGGPSSHAAELAGALLRLGHEVELLGIAAPDARLGARDGLPWTTLAAPPETGSEPGPLADAHVLAAGLAESDAQVAHAEDDVGGHAAVLNRDRGGPPVLRTVHHVAAHDDPDLEELQRASIADADLCATATAHWARRVDELFGVTATVVRNGVNAERFLAAAGASAVAEGRPVVLTMGGIERRKGSRVLLEAFARARRRLGGHPLLLVAGASGGEERYRSAWAEDADRLGLRVGDGADDAIDVRLVGAVADGDLPRLIAGADVHVVASTREGSSLAVLEAACAGVPSVVTDLPALREELADGRDCLMVPPGESRALADAMVALVTDRDRARALVDAGRAAARARAWADVAAEHVDLYRRLTGLSARS